MTEVEPAATRQDIVRWWLDLATGRSGLEQVHAWALRHLEYNDDVEELVIQGLLYLLSTSPGVNSESKPIFDDLAKWRRELERFDADPDRYKRARLQRMLIDFSARFGTEETEVFARKMVRNGYLSEADVAEARSQNHEPHHGH